MGEEKPAVQLAGLRIVGPGYGLNGTELRTFHQPSGTTLAFLVRAPENKKIVEVDDSKCSLAAFTDDRGFNLLDGVDWDGFPEISNDGRLALIKVTSKTRASQDASHLFARGTIHVRLAAAEETEKIEHLELKVGAKADIRQEVIQVMKAQVENEGLSLVLQVSLKFKNDIKDIRFYLADGRPVEIWGRGSFTFGNATQLEYNLDTKSTPEAVKVEIDLWQEQEILNLPFEIESSVGF